MIDDPGASSERNEAEFENDDTASDFVVDPTLTTPGTQPGALIAFVAPSLPAATTVAMPAERRLATATVYAAMSHGAVKRPPAEAHVHGRDRERAPQLVDTLERRDLIGRPGQRARIGAAGAERAGEAGEDLHLDDRGVRRDAVERDRRGVATGGDAGHVGAVQALRRR